MTFTHVVLNKFIFIHFLRNARRNDETPEFLIFLIQLTYPRLFLHYLTFNYIISIVQLDQSFRSRKHRRYFSLFKSIAINYSSQYLMSFFSIGYSNSTWNCRKQYTVKLVNTIGLVVYEKKNRKINGWQTLVSCFVAPKSRSDVFIVVCNYNLTCLIRVNTLFRYAKGSGCG